VVVSSVDSVVLDSDSGSVVIGVDMANVDVTAAASLKEVVTCSVVSSSFALDCAEVVADARVVTSSLCVST
jgi:hypothetical protein